MCALLVLKLDAYTSILCINAMFALMMAAHGLGWRSGFNKAESIYLDEKA